MRHGITVLVDPVKEDLVAMADSPSLTFRAMADGEGRLTHVVAESGKSSVVLTPATNGPTGNYGANALRLEGKALRALRAFLKAHPRERTELYFGPDSFDEPHLAFIAYDRVGEGYDKLKVWQSGIISLTSDWGSMDYWDQWVIDPRSGEVTYTGTVDGYRYLPTWLWDALRS